MANELNRTSNAISTITSSLLEGVREDSDDSWSRLKDIYGPLVYAWCRRQNLDTDAALDVSQDVFLAVSQSVKRFRRDQPGHTFRGWLRTVTRSKLANYWQRQKKQIEKSGYPVDWDPECRAAEPESTEEEIESGTRILIRQTLQLVKKNVTPVNWQAFWLVAVEDRDAGDVSDELGISRNQVYLAKGRILKRLRKEFGDVADVLFTPSPKELDAR